MATENESDRRNVENIAYALACPVAAAFLLYVGGIGAFVGFLLFAFGALFGALVLVLWLRDKTYDGPVGVAE